MIEEHFRVLKVMNDVTNRIDLDGFANMVGLNPKQTIERVKELANSGLVRKVGGGYGITDKGKTILNAIEPVSKDMVFHFYVEISQPAGVSAENLKDFSEIVKTIDIKSVEFHMDRGDFENWIKSAYKDEELVNQIAKLKNTDLRGEELRKELVAAIRAKYAF